MTVLKSTAKGTSPEFLSLFCGCGGLDLGFEQAGFETGLAYDLRPPAVLSHNYNRGKANAFVHDISKLTLKELDRDYGGKFKPVGVVGGPPCQSFSRGNSSKRKDDPRSGMVRIFFDLALELHRKRGGLDFIVMENVAEIATADGGKLLSREITRLENEGFSVTSEVYNAKNYGVPQNRRRLILIALNSERIVNGWITPEKNLKVKTLRDSIEGLREPVHYSTAKMYDEFPEHPNHWCMTPKSPKFQKGGLTPGRSTGRSFKTLDWDKPSYTVSYGHREVHVHPNCHRRLSVYEAMLLQGFPKRYELKGTLSAQFSQVSEAVPPPLARAIASSVIASLFEDSSQISKTSKAA